MEISAVIFDLGGVVFGSPMEAFRSYERETGLPHRFVSELILGTGTDGAWSRFERGEIGMPDFCAALDGEARSRDTDGGRFSATALMTSLANGTAIRPAMLSAIRALRAADVKTAALTNNWDSPDQDGKMVKLRSEFDVFIESWRVKMRKPDPKIYQHVCDALGVAPGQVAFLDDIGANLKPARAIGMTTIKVTDPRQALSELSALVGVTFGA